MVNCGLLPLGVEPCSRNRSMLNANTGSSLLAKVESIGFKGGTVPSLEPGLFTPPCPCGPWHFWQLAMYTIWPLVELLVRFSAWPGPPELDGRTIAGPLGVGVPAAVFKLMT